MAVFDSKFSTPTGTELDVYLEPELRVARGELPQYYDASDINVLQPVHRFRFDRHEGWWRILSDLKGPYAKGAIWKIEVDYPTTLDEAYVVVNNKSYRMKMPMQFRTPRSNLTSNDFVFENLLPLLFRAEDSVKLVIKLGRDEHGPPRLDADQEVKVTYRILRPDEHPGYPETAPPRCSSWQ